ncbi:MAG: GNAT family N-acetyltransferase [Beijerinckiaceae bacterium]
MHLTALDTQAHETMGVAGERLARIRTGSAGFLAVCLTGDAARHALLQAANTMPAATPFQSAFWLDHWYAYLGAADRTALVVCVKRQGDQAPSLVLPLVLHRERMQRIISYADCGVTDYNAPLMLHRFSVSQDDVAALLESILLSLPRADILLLDKMPFLLQGCVNPLTQISACRPSRLHGNLVAAGESFDEFVRAFHRKFRKELGREKRVFEAFEGAQFIAVKSLAEADEVMIALERIQAARMSALERNYDLDTAAKQGFYRALLRDGLASGSVTLTALKVRDEIIAALFCVNRDGHCAMVRIAQAGGEWSVCSPGRLIIMETMRWLHMQGFRTFDFTIGAYDYKRRLGAAHVPLARIMIALSVRGQVMVLRERLLDRMRATPWIRAWVQRWRGVPARPATE